MSNFIVAAKRTAFGAFGGKLANYTANELGGIASLAAVNQVGKNVVDSVIFGNVLQTSADAAYLARHVGHRAGCPISTPAITLNRLCGSGFQAVISACQEIDTQQASVVLAGGTESMSQAPYAVRGIRSGFHSSNQGTRFGVNQVMEDTLSSALTDAYPTPTPMGITAENLASQL